MTTPKFPGRPRVPARARVKTARTAPGTTLGGPPPPATDPSGQQAATADSNNQAHSPAARPGRTRRGLLAGAAGALGVLTAETVANAQPAAASNPPVLLGTDNTGATTRTGIFTTNNNEWAQLADPGNAGKGSLGVYAHGQTYGVYADTGGTGGNGNGVAAFGSGLGYGVTGSGGPSGGIGVIGRGADATALVLGVGQGVVGVGGGNGDGVQGFGSGFGAGVTGSGGGSNGIGVADAGVLAAVPASGPGRRLAALSPRSMCPARSAPASWASAGPAMSNIPSSARATDPSTHSTVRCSRPSTTASWTGPSSCSASRGCHSSRTPSTSSRSSRSDACPSTPSRACVSPEHPPQPIHSNVRSDTPPHLTSPHLTHPRATGRPTGTQASRP